LASKIAEANEHGLWTVSGGTVSDGGLSLVDGVGFDLDADAKITNWIACNTKASAVTATPVDLNVAPTDDTYQVLRLEVESDGDCKFYIDGILQATVATGATTTAVLIPFISLDEAGTSAANTLSIDYVSFSGPRPVSNA